jgi:SET domain-containing protein
MPRSKNSATLTSTSIPSTSPLITVYDSPIHGRGVRALMPIKKGSRVIEYLGERVSHDEADRRYDLKGQDDGHTFLFIASNRTVIDAGVNGNEARYVNHSCAPNCETIIEKSRVFIEAIRNIKPGEELGYDYQLTWESTDDPAELANYTCRCGAKRCRGTMLDRHPLDLKDKLLALEAKQKREKARKRALKQAQAGGAAKAKSKSKAKARKKK